MKNSFPKNEKLKRQKLIERLFSEGTSHKSFPLKVFYLVDSNLESTQAAFSVPKRNFKNAVDRNRIKRQMREAYRLQKNHFETNNGKKLAVLFVYMGRKLPAFKEIAKAMTSLLKKYHT